MARRLGVWRLYSMDVAHHLPAMPADHKCHRMHGHTYRLRVTVDGGLDPVTGFVVEYAELDAAVRPVIADLDHRVLNDIPGLACPTVEVLALWLWDRIAPALPPGVFLRDIHIQETEAGGVTLAAD